MTHLRIEEERRALMKEKFLAVGTVLLLFVLRLPSADAQVKSTGAVLGTAKDATGGVIGGARVTLKNADTGVSMATETNATGDYSFPVVPVGQYELTVSASGFKTTVLSSISVSALENVRLNVTLSVGPVSQQVTVTAAPAAVNTVTADEGNTVAGAQVRNLPLASRLFTQLVFLEPGVVGSNPTSPTGGRGFPSGSVRDFYLDGARSDQNNLHGGRRRSPDSIG